MGSVLGFLKTTIIGGLLFLIPLIVIGVILAKAYEVMKAIANPLSRFLATDTVADLVRIVATDEAVAHQLPLHRFDRPDHPWIRRRQKPDLRHQQ